MRSRLWLMGLTLLVGVGLAGLSVWARTRFIGFGFMVTALLAFAVVGLEVFAQRRAELDEPAQPMRGAAAHSGPAPYRGRLQRAVQRMTRPLSGVTLCVVVSGCFIAAAVLVPLQLGLSPWFEAELVLLSWWLLAFALASWLLFRGYRVRDDAAATGWPWGGPVLTPQPEPQRSDRGQVPDAEPHTWSADASSLALIGVAFAGASWLVVEVLLPLVFLAVYALTRAALVHVLNDGHDCEGRLLRSVFWGGFWATLYVGPLGVLLWAVAALSRG